MSMSKHLRLAGIIALLLVAFALRVYRLGDVNVWWDEAYSVWLARMNLADAINITARDVHPPLYYALLHFSIRLWGSGEFAIRYLSVIPALLTSAILFSLGKGWLGTRRAAFGLLWLAVSRFHIWWSQETRMYTWAAFWAVWVFYFLWRQTSTRPSKWGWPAYVFGLSAGLYTLYLFGLVYPAVGLTVVALWFSKRISTRILWQWVLATAVSLALFVPWALFSTPNQPGQPATNSSIVHLLQLYLTLLANGESTNIDRFSFLAGGFMLLAGIGFYGLFLKKQIAAISFLFPAFILPPVIAIILFRISEQIYTPAIEARYYLLLAPMNLLALTTALAVIASFWRRAAVLLSVAVLAIAITSLPGYYKDRHLRDQWKSAMMVIQAYARPSDRLLLVSGDRYPLFLYEYEKWQGERPSIHLVPDGAPVINAKTVAEQMTKAVADSEHIWWVEIERNMQDPEGLARIWLEERFQPTYAASYDHNSLTLFTRDGLLPPLNFDVDESGVTTPLSTYWPGDTAHLGILTDGSDSRAAVLHESGLVLMTSPLDSAGFSFVDLPFPITQAAPNGRYTVRIDDQDAAAFQVENSDPLLSSADIPERTGVEFGSIRLLGFAIESNSPSPGDTIQLDLYWQTTEPVETDYTVFTQLAGPFNAQSGNPLWGQHDSPPVSGSFPTTAWPVGMIIRDRHALTFSGDAPAADYTLLVGMYDSRTGTRLPISGAGIDAVELLKFSVP